MKRLVLGILALLASAAVPAQGVGGGGVVGAGIAICISATPTNGYVLTYNASLGCWNAQASSSGSGTVTSVSVTTANGYSGTVATATTTPAITLSGPSISAVSHQFLTALSSGGTFSQAQPAFSDLSGSATGAQLPNPSASTLGGIESLSCATHNWLNVISTSGVPSCSQPASTDISGLGTAATVNTGTSGATIPLLNGANTWSGGQTFSSTVTPTSTIGIVGTTTNDSTQAGSFGEYWEAYCSVVTSGASIAFTNASPTVGTYSSPPWALINGSQAAFGSFACPFVITANAPTGLTTATNYWAVPINSTTFHVATSAANAMAGTFANTTGTSSTANLTSTVSVTTGTVIATAAMKLTAGDWDCTSLAIFVPTATTSVTALASGVGTSSTALPAIATTFVTAADVLNVTTTSPFNQPSSPYRISLASTTAEYADVEGVFTASTLTAASDFRCRRMR